MRNSPYEPEAVHVTEEDGMVKAVKIRKRAFRVRQVLNVWRIDEDWWREPVSRLYLLLELESGARLTVFRDLIHGEWYRQNYGV